MTNQTDSIVILNISESDKRKLTASGISSIQLLKQLLSDGSLKKRVKGGGDAFVSRMTNAVHAINRSDEKSAIPANAVANSTVAGKERIAFIGLTLGLGVAVYWFLDSQDAESLGAVVALAVALVIELFWNSKFNWQRVIVVTATLGVATLTWGAVLWIGETTASPNPELAVVQPPVVEALGERITAKRPVAASSYAGWPKIAATFSIGTSVEPGPWGPIQSVMQENDDAITPELRRELDEERRVRGYEHPQVDRHHFGSPVLDAASAPFSLSLSTDIEAWICVYALGNESGERELIRRSSDIGGASRYPGRVILGQVDEPIRILVCVFPLTEQADQQLQDSFALHPCAWSQGHLELCISRPTELK